MKKWTFHPGFSMLLTHELDAALHHEWRVLPMIGALPEATGRVVFLLAHVPIFAGLVAWAAGEDPGIRSGTRIGVGLFLLVHALLHLLFREHPAYEFSAWLSYGLIFGGAALGDAFLVSVWKERGVRVR